MPNEFKNFGEFGGMSILDLPEKISDRNCSYSNAIDYSRGGMISVIGSSTTTLGVIDAGVEGSTSSGSMFLFKKAYGTFKEILVRTYWGGSPKKMYLQWFNDNSTLNSGAGQWELLFGTGFNSSSRWGFANANGDGGEAINKLIMGNGVDWMMFWNGATSRLASVTSNTIVCNTNLATEGFTVNAYGIADHILINGNDFTYTGISGTTFTGVSPDPRSSLSGGIIKVGDGVTHEADDRLMRESLYTSNTIAFATTGATTGNYLNDANALFITNSEFQLGQRITVVGATNAQNNNTFTIKTLTETTITFDDGELATSEAVGAVVTVSAGTPKGNILLTAQGKLFMAGVTSNESKVYYSKTQDTTDFSISSGLGSGGSFILMEGGGAITALDGGNSSTIIVHKNNLISSYSRSINSSNLVIEDFNTLISGYGVGAINNNCIAIYDKQHYFLNGNGEVKILSQSLYSSTIFDISNISDTIKDFLSKSLTISSTQYLIYNPDKHCLVISTIHPDTTGTNKNFLVYLFVKQGAQGYVYDSSIERIVFTYLEAEVPLVYFNSGNYRASVITYFPFTRNSYVWMGERTQGTLSSAAVYMTKEYTFQEPVKDKEFSVVSLDGYIYADTIIKITVLYGKYGEDGIKNIFLNSTSPAVNGIVTSAEDKNFVGEYSMPMLYKNTMIRGSKYFKLPFHVDVNKSDRYKIKIETWGTISGTWWAINNISTNVVLKEMDYNKLVSQNETSLDGVGAMIIGTTNIVR